MRSTSEPGAGIERHAAIAGAGLVGRLLAWRLARSGWRVTLFDAAPRGDRRAASHVAAAMLAPWAERPGSPAEVFDLARQAMALWPVWLDELHAESGRVVYFRRDGTLVLAHGVDLPNLHHFESLLKRSDGAATAASAQPEGLSLHALDGPAIDALEPALSGRFQQGLWLQGEGQLANDELLDALQSVLEASPRVDWRQGCPVRALDAQRVTLADGSVEADVVVDARGVGARADAPGLRGVRGEVLTVECPGVSLRRPVRLMHPRYQLYVAPRPAHRFVVGATELESQDSGPPSLRSVLELGSALYSLHPGFGEARVLQLSAALRPAFDDHRPMLREQRGVWQLNGLYRHGYLCGPALVNRFIQVLHS